METAWFAIGSLGLLVVLIDLVWKGDSRVVIVGALLSCTGFTMQRLVGEGEAGGFWYVYPVVAAALLQLSSDLVARLRGGLRSQQGSEPERPEQGPSR